MNNMNNIDNNKTVFMPGGGGVTGTQAKTDGSILTVFEGNQPPRTINLGSFGKGCIYFGRDPRSDIVFTSPLVSTEHGRFVYRNGFWAIEDKAVYKGQPSTNGLIYNNVRINGRCIFDGDFIRIDDKDGGVSTGVLFVFSSADASHRWTSTPLVNNPRLTIGRDNRCSIVLPHVSVSKLHATITYERDGYYICDNNSTNGVILNNRRIRGKVRLHEKDVIVITNTKLIFTSREIYYCSYKNGISVVASDIVIERGRSSKKFITSNHVNLDIKPGELVAIIGGSGAGKSTVLNAMCGYLPPTHGDVFINGVELYKNLDSLKKLIGYVPQSDIVYDNLSLHDMLLYAAKLRLPDDTSPAEIEAAITRAIKTVDLEEKRDSLIKALSGGQRKRASIAVELLSDPNLIFLDEPASGLDPGTERSLMGSLRAMADKGKTVILVTHSTLQLKMCDKIVFMGKGGNLCFYGSHDEALKFFGVSDVVDVYNMITDHADFWKAKYEKINPPVRRVATAAPPAAKADKNKIKQLKVISMRYLKLICNDRQRLMLLIGQAPLLALLIGIVAPYSFLVAQMQTKAMFFALSCAGFWVGMFDTIQEVCKERQILRREYMTGLSLTSYISSKMIVMAVMTFIQSLLITVTLFVTVGIRLDNFVMPEGALGLGVVEIFITIYLTALSSAAMGLLVSSFFNNADRAMTTAPILILPQILFSNTLISLDSPLLKAVSNFITCRWSLLGLGFSSDINSKISAVASSLEDNEAFQNLKDSVGKFDDLAKDLVELETKADTYGFSDYFEIPEIPKTPEIPPAEDFAAGANEGIATVFSKDIEGYEAMNVILSWVMLIVFTFAFLALARLVLSKIRKEKS